MGDGWMDHVAVRSLWEKATRVESSSIESCSAARSRACSDSELAGRLFQCAVCSAAGARASAEDTAARRAPNALTTDTREMPTSRQERLGPPPCPSRRRRRRSCIFARGRLLPRCVGQSTSSKPIGAVPPEISCP
jgi:hypothetical protein